MPYSTQLGIQLRLQFAGLDINSATRISPEEWPILSCEGLHDFPLGPEILYICKLANVAQNR